MTVDTKVERADADYIIALIPITGMKEIIGIIERRLSTYVNAIPALELHRYQYNRPDPEEALSIKAMMTH
ncbi:hypothetical protein JCM16161A_12690 [Vulcanisaeta sp. JCM 16161]|uniref:hypothetical protein n=1 Tax=Vulcanisaeta sp. JCM 16161 TaxID=1295372 RepID=UPI0006D080F1|nr:hypothetical protein [Vulcanisaeta sp. JCM 16161]